MLRRMTIIVLIWLVSVFSASADTGYKASFLPESVANDTLTQSGWEKLYQQNRIDEAQADFLQALERRPDDVWAAYGLNIIYLMRADVERLLSNSLKLLRHESEHPVSELSLRSIESLSDKISGYGERVEPILREMLEVSDDLNLEMKDIAYGILANIYDRWRQPENYQTAVQHLGYIKKWNTLGPYGKFSNINFFTELSPESEKVLKKNYSYQGTESEKKRFVSVDGWINPPWFEDGLYYAETFVRCPKPVRAVIRIRSSQSIKLFVNGHELYSKDALTKYVPSTELIELQLAKGWNRVMLKFIYNTGSPRVALQILPRQELALKVDTKNHRYSDKQSYSKLLQPRLCDFFQKELQARPDNSFAAGMLGIARGFYGDNEQRKALLYQALKKNPQYAYFNYMLATSLRGDRSQPQKVALSKARPFYQKALDLAAVYPAVLYYLSRYDEDENKYPQAIEKLKLAISQAPRFRSLRHALYNIYTSKEWEHERRQELERIIELLPDAPLGYRIGWDYYSEKKDEDMLERMVEALSRMKLITDYRARLEASRGNTKNARREYEYLLAERSYNLSYAESLLDIMINQDDLSAASRLLERMIEIATPDEKERFQEKLAQLYFQRGREKRGRKLLEKILEQNPVNPRARNGLKLWGQKDVLDRFEIDPFQKIDQAGFLEQYRQYGAVMLIDQLVQEIYPDLSNRQKVHQLVWLNSKAAINEWAEVNLPGNIEILELRTIKKDGTISEPEIIPSAKTSISMTDVNKGDLIEIKYVTWEKPSSVLPRGYLGDKFYFQLLNYPNQYAQYVLIYPEQLEVEWENANGVAAPVTGELDQNRRYAIWEQRDNPAITPEPASAHSDHYIPYIQVGCNLDDETMLRWYENLNMGRTRPSYELQQALNRIIGSASVLRDKVQRIYHFISTEIDGSFVGGLMTEDAGKTFAAKRGSRLALLACFLDMVGVKYEIVVSKQFGQKDSTVFPHNFAGGLIKAMLDDDSTYLDVSQKYFPVGFIASRIQGMEAKTLMTGISSENRIFEIPELDPEGNTNSCLAKLTLDENGTVSGEITRTFRGSMAAGLRRGLIRMERYQIKNMLQKLVSSNFRAANLTQFDFKSLHEIDQPLVIGYSFEAANYSRVKEQELVLDQGFYLTNAATSYAQVNQRKIPMQLNSNSHFKYRVELTLPAEHTMLEYPGRLDLVNDFGTYISAYELEDSRLIYTKKFILPLQQVSPERYDEFKKFCAAIDEFERKDLIIRKTKASVVEE